MDEDRDGRTATRVEADAALLAAYRAALAVATETRLDAVLQRIVDLAREVVPARYAALGVAGADGSGRLSQFLYAGIGPEVAARIGPLPEGHGLLGVLIHQGRPLLLDDMASDPRSVGFPDHHPPMRTLLGVPILIGDRAVGNLYLSERDDGQSFTQGDLAAVQVLALHAATAIQRAELIAELGASRQRAEEQRDHLQVILDQLPAGVLIHRAPDGRIELANTAARRMLLGGDAGADLPTLGRDYDLLRADGTPLPPDEGPERRARRGETVAEQQITVARADGGTRPVLVQAAPLRDAGGEISRSVVVFQDVTRLREAEQLKDDFLALVSHEFRTPLTAIHGGAHLLATQGDALDDGVAAEILADVVGESIRLDQMLANMLSLAQVTAGRLEPGTEPVLVEPLVRRVARGVAARAPGFRFTIDVPADLPALEGDPSLLEQVLRNLYENAIKYAPDGGDIRTTADHDGARVTVRVTDPGVGIAPEHVPHVFERFRRPGADPTVRGMGLGLYLCRHLMEAQGGRITVESPGAGRGATFSLDLPVAHGWHES